MIRMKVFNLQDEDTSIEDLMYGIKGLEKY